MADKRLTDGQPIYTTSGKTRLQLERENQALWKKSEDLRRLLDHLPDKDARILDTNSAQELAGLHNLIHRVAAKVNPEVDGPRFSQSFDKIEGNIFRLASDWMKTYGDGTPRNKVSATRSKATEWMRRFPDIVRLSRYDPNGTLVIQAAVTRWLHLEIFSRDLSGIFPNVEELFDAFFLERVDNPKRSVLEQRRWYQLTYASIVAHPDYPQARETRETELATDLEQLFSFLHPDVETYQRVLSDIIRPAMSLQERTALTVQQPALNFYDIPTNPTAEYLEQFANTAVAALTCVDATNNHRKIDFTEENKGALAKTVLPICSLSPVITFREIEMLGGVTLSHRGFVVCTNGDEETKAKHLLGIKPSIFYECLVPNQI
ncbi:uncharacterized protein GGS22DRAFT_198345 [Annulohypoxylon maeteangense]|uniref:uncharacterized protein n=1 Tax=Annulohypoxylon maeteangense TaxID=1927788 RepID=UPI002007C838|nr:uncharacterized protein GGS22DRAFT_198345 [Annulohypoxylon maeteangense]KAI0880141.1 hypothetical protein GGS22DRAFT_198345 [Annulohypoxylon maeteangense]